MSAVDTAFESLLYGEGSFFGLLILSVLIVGLVLKWRVASVFTLPIAILLAINYLDHSLGWHFMIMVFEASFIIFYIVLEKVRRN